MHFGALTLFKCCTVIDDDLYADIFNSLCSHGVSGQPIMGGATLFGVLGIIYGPLVVAAFLTLTDIYHTRYQYLADNDCIETIR
jgi:hypothetical protein